MRETTSVKAMMKGTSSMKDAMWDFADQVATMEKNVMTVVLDATEKIARLTNCQSFLMFESKGRRYFCGSEDLCHLYLTTGLVTRDSDERFPGSSFPDSMEGDIDPLLSDVDDDGFEAEDMKPHTPESASVILDDEVAKSEISAASSTTSFVAEEEVEEGGTGIESEVEEKGDNNISEELPVAEAPSQVRRKRGCEGFRCYKCPKSFPASSVLKRHLASQHDIGSYKFLCLKCNFCTVRKDSMQGHMRSRHDEEGDEFIKQVAYQKYKRTYPTRKEFKSFRSGDKRLNSLQTKGTSEPRSFLDPSEKETAKGSAHTNSVTATESVAPKLFDEPKRSDRHYQCHLCVKHYTQGHHLGLHLRVKHGATWNEYLNSKLTVGKEQDSEVVVKRRRGRPKKSTALKTTPLAPVTSNILDKSRMTLNKKMLKTFRSAQAIKSPISSSSFAAENPSVTPNSKIDVGGFMVNYDSSKKKLVCPLCQGAYAGYPNLRRHVLRDHEPRQDQVLCRFGNCRIKFRNKAEASAHLLGAHNSARDDKYLKILPLHLGDFFKSHFAVASTEEGPGNCGYNGEENTEEIF